MRTFNLVGLAGAIAVAVLGLGACSDRVDDVIPANDPPAVTATVAEPERIPNDCGRRFAYDGRSVYC
jgi:hypothetical protein